MKPPRFATDASRKRTSQGGHNAGRCLPLQNDFEVRALQSCVIYDATTTSEEQPSNQARRPARSGVHPKVTHHSSWCRERNHWVDAMNRRCCL